MAFYTKRDFRAISFHVLLLTVKYFQDIYLLHLIRRFVSELIEYSFISTWKSGAWIREKIHHCQKEPKRNEHEHRRKNKPHTHHETYLHIMKVYGTLSTNPPIITPWIASQVKKITDCLFTDSRSVWVFMFERGKDEIFCWHIPDVFPFRNRRIWNAVNTRFLCSVSTVSARYDLDHDSATNERLAFLNSRLYASSYKYFLINIMKHFSRTSSIHT